MRNLHRSSVVALIWLAAAVIARAQQPAPADDTAQFTILVGGRSIGTATTTVTRGADGWTLAARESLGAPFDLATSQFQIRYNADWQPVSLEIEGTRNSQTLLLTSTFSGNQARTTGMQRGQEFNISQAVSPRTIVVPTDFFPAYEGLAARLPGAATGATFPLYVAPQGEVQAVVRRTMPHHLMTAAGPVEVREFDVDVSNPGAPLPLELWIDSHDRLVRLAVPASRLVMIRDDLASVMTREETVTRAGDQEVFIPALGFSLSGTVSVPEHLAGRAPAIVLVGAPGRQDRDEATAGVPVFAQLANALADAGFLVVRYDKRGVGRSGGRAESATLADYAGDALSVVDWMRKRPDVDRDRLAIVGYAEGAATALIAAAREHDIGAVCLISPPGQTGAELTFLQQQRALARSNEPEAATQAKLALQQRVINAVINGGAAWDGIPDDVRRQAETAWFKSWLVFDPATLMKKVDQPVLIVAPSLDADFPADQADRLEALARQRKKSATQKVVVPGVDHALVSTTADAEMDARNPADRSISPVVGSAMARWLEDALPKKQ
jgi:pimeloyl-ACP methyl ester carboxylesterase